MVNEVLRCHSLDESTGTTFYQTLSITAHKAEMRKHKPDDKVAEIALLRLNTPSFFGPTEQKDLLEISGEQVNSAYHIRLGLRNRFPLTFKRQL
ncbi:hypothetical protein ACD591_19110 [Rufibacter glacialis]|uniref:Uncharacterized protein n=1 Tax=Rufibacter glacialis TaxID=1259555 RepID=A0A5M8QPR4_9BACT|nr:hypothetical protein [Rufibacter glacialis]KAA6438069.1 hypothetical protein FOE74_00040 [Rufibacter glacialis]GGK88264.1 hypothetical protein GCM10011405_40040 [Rufibacter glacialis]